MTDRTSTFRQLHDTGGAFLLANVWDRGSARMLEALGAPAIATSSAAHAFTRGRPDGGTLTRSEALDHAADLADAVDIPIQGDFENGFGHSPEACAETVRLSIDAGLSGICIEDTALPDQTAYDFDHAVDRIRAAAEAVRGDFILTARADGVMTGAYDDAEALRRLQAFSEAGAQCLYAPLPSSWEWLARMTAETDKPLNALVAGPFTGHSRADFAGIGVARLSLGSSLARLTHRAIHDAARAMAHGDFSSLAGGAPGDMIDALLTRG